MQGKWTPTHLVMGDGGSDTQLCHKGKGNPFQLTKNAELNGFFQFDV